MTPAAQALSTALLHFVWQGIVVSVLLGIALFLLRERSAGLRYTVSCLALVALFVAPVITGLAVYDLAMRPGVGPAIPAAITIFPNAAISDGTFDVQAQHTWILSVWFAGVMAFGVRLLWAGGHSYVLQRRGTSADSSIVSMVRELAERCGVHSKIQVLLSAIVEVPSVVGWLRPVILLPPAAIFGLTPQQLEAVVAHELAHIRRHDYFINILQMVVETLFFYHPAVWWISSRIRYERELCCDDFAVRLCGNAVTYARALATLEKLRPMRPTLAMGSANGPLLHRIQRLLGSERIEHGPSKLTCAVGLLVGVLSLSLFMGSARAQQDEAPKTFQDNADDASRAALARLQQNLEAIAPAAALPPTPPTPSVKPPAQPASAAPVIAPAPPPAPASPQLNPQPPVPPAPPAPSAITLLSLLQKLEGLTSLQDTRWVSSDGKPGLLFRLDGKSYVIWDPEILDRVRALNAPSDDHVVAGQLQAAELQAAELNSTEARLQLSRASKELEFLVRQIEEQLRNLPLANNPDNQAEFQKQVDRMVAENARLTAMIRRLEADLNRTMAQQLRIQAQMAATAADKSRREAERRRVEEILREAVRNGKAEVGP